MPLVCDEAGHFAPNSPTAIVDCHALLSRIRQSIPERDQSAVPLPNIDASGFEH